MSKKVFNTGITERYGYYLTEFLLEKEYKFHGKYSIC